MTIFKVKFWDLRMQQPAITLQLPERVHCADVDARIAVFSTAGRHIIAFPLDNNPAQMLEFDLKNSSEIEEHRCISIFQNKKGETGGFAVADFGGQVVVNYVNSIHTTTVFILIYTAGYSAFYIYFSLYRIIFIVMLHVLSMTSSFIRNMERWLLLARMVPSVSGTKIHAKS